MKDHYRLSDAGYKMLLSQGITVADLFHATAEFNAQEVEVGMVQLMYYIDKFGGAWVEEEFKRKNDRIAFAVFDELDIPRKIQVAEYADGNA